jgi:hypothetical protein
MSDEFFSKSNVATIYEIVKSQVVKSMNYDISIEPHWEASIINVMKKVYAMQAQYRISPSTPIKEKMRILSQKAIQFAVYHIQTEIQKSRQQLASRSSFTQQAPQQQPKVAPPSVFEQQSQLGNNMMSQHNPYSNQIQSMNTKMSQPVNSSYESMSRGREVMEQKPAPINFQDTKVETTNTDIQKSYEEMLRNRANVNVPAQPSSGQQQPNTGISDYNTMKQQTPSNMDESFMPSNSTDEPEYLSFFNSTTVSEPTNISASNMNGDSMNYSELIRASNMMDVAKQEPIKMEVKKESVQPMMSQMNQPVNQMMMGQAMSQMNQPANQMMMGQSMMSQMNQPANQMMMSQPMNQPMGQQMNQMMVQPMSQPVNQATNQMMGQPIIQSVSHQQAITREAIQVLPPEHRYVQETYPTNIAQGDLNPLKKKIVNKVLSFCTRFRSNYEETSATDFTFNLPYPLKNVLSMKLASFELPISNYRYSDKKGSNKMTITDACGSHVLIIPDGNYQAMDFDNYIVDVLSWYPDLSGRYMIEVSPFTGKTTVTNLSGDSFDMDFSQSNLDLKRNMGWIWGFRKPFYTGSYVYESEGIYNSDGPDYIYFVVNDYTLVEADHIVGMFENSYIDKNILARLTVSTDKFQVLVNLMPDTFKKREYHGPINISRLSIKLLDEYGIPLDLNNMDYSFSLEFELGYNY